MPLRVAQLRDADPGELVGAHMRVLQVHVQAHRVAWGQHHHLGRPGPGAVECGQQAVQQVQTDGGHEVGDEHRGVDAGHNQGNGEKEQVGPLEQLPPPPAHRRRRQDGHACHYHRGDGAIDGALAGGVLYAAQQDGDAVLHHIHRRVGDDHRLDGIHARLVEEQGALVGEAQGAVQDAAPADRHEGHGQHGPQGGADGPPHGGWVDLQGLGDVDGQRDAVASHDDQLGGAPGRQRGGRQQAVGHQPGVGHRQLRVVLRVKRLAAHQMAEEGERKGGPRAGQHNLVQNVEGRQQAGVQDAGPAAGGALHVHRQGAVVLAHSQAVLGQDASRREGGHPADAPNHIHRQLAGTAARRRVQQPAAGDDGAHMGVGGGQRDGEGHGKGAVDCDCRQALGPGRQTLDRGRVVGVGVAAVAEHHRTGG